MGGEKAKKTVTIGSNLWITPAWAGKSQPRTACHGTSWDHPRMGGEKTKKIP